MAMQYILRVDRPALEYYTKVKLKHIQHAIKIHDSTFAIREYAKLARTHDKYGNHATAMDLLQKARDVRIHSKPYRERVKSALKSLKIYAKIEKRAIKRGNAERANAVFHVMHDLAFGISDPKVLRKFREWMDDCERHVERAVRKNGGYDSVNNLILAIRHGSTKVARMARPFIGFGIQRK